MALDWLLPAAMAGGQGFVDMYQSKKNRKFQSEQNAMDRQFQWDVYHQQRNDALADRQHLEEYNSPYAQMNRLKQGGLNPALMYTQGTVGQTEQPRQAQPSGGSQPAQQMNLDGLKTAMNTFFTLLKTQQETSNLQAQANLIEKQARLSGIEGDTKEFQLGVERDLRPTTIKSANLQADILQADLELKKQAKGLNYDANERAQLKNSTDVAKTLEEIKAIRQKRLFELKQQPNIAHKLDAEIEKLELEMRLIDQQIQAIEIANKYAPQSNEMKLLLQELDAEIKRGGGNVSGIISKMMGRLENTLSPEEVKELKRRYPNLFK